MKLISWNINGIRAVHRKGFLKFLQKEKPDIICLQEIKAREDQLPEDLQNIPGYHAIWHPSERAGYAGVAILTRKKPLEITHAFETDFVQYHDRGRILECKFPRFTLLNFYVPNGGTRADGREMLSYKLDFYERLIKYTKKLLQKGESAILTGDFNVAHTEIDLARPQANKDHIGFLPVERVELDKLLKIGMVDTFRAKYPKLKDQYTWWSHRASARANNVGWRLDYFFVSPDLEKKVKSIQHLTEVFGSDHCPILLKI